MHYCYSLGPSTELFLARVRRTRCCGCCGCGGTCGLPISIILQSSELELREGRFSWLHQLQDPHRGPMAPSGEPVVADLPILSAMSVAFHFIHVLQAGQLMDMCSPLHRSLIWHTFRTFRLCHRTYLHFPWSRDHEHCSNNRLKSGRNTVAWTWEDWDPCWFPLSCHKLAQRSVGGVHEVSHSLGQSLK